MHVWIHIVKNQIPTPEGGVTYTLGLTPAGGEFAGDVPRRQFASWRELETELAGSTPLSAQDIAPRKVEVDKEGAIIIKDLRLTQAQLHGLGFDTQQLLRAA